MRNRKELMYLRRVKDTGQTIILNEKDADLINYEEVERRYDLQCLENLRLSKKPRPRDIIFSNKATKTKEEFYLQNIFTSSAK